MVATFPKIDLQPEKKPTNVAVYPETVRVQSHPHIIPFIHIEARASDVCFACLFDMRRPHHHVDGEMRGEGE